MSVTHLDTLKAMRNYAQHRAAHRGKWEMEDFWPTQVAALDAAIAALERLARVRVALEAIP